MTDAFNSTTSTPMPESIDQEKYVAPLPHDTNETTQKQTSDGTGFFTKPISFYFSFLSMSLCMFIVTLDTTALTVALPAITEDLGGTTFQAFWAGLAEILACIISQPLCTNLSDVLGRKITLYSGYALFFTGALIMALAQTMNTLIAGRLLLGLGAGSLEVLSIIILSDITTLKERPLYLALYGIPMAGGSIGGPIVGAAFTQYSTWRWIGWINLPIAGLGFILGFFFLRLRPIDRSFGQKLRRLDWIGMALFTCGATLFSLPMTWAGTVYPWSSWRTILPFLIGVVLLIVLAFYEKRPLEPVFPYRIFSNRTAAITMLGAFLHGAILYSGMQYTPLFFQAVYLESPFSSAVSFLPVCCTIVGFSVIGPALVQVTRRYQWAILLGWIFIATGTGLWALWQISSPKELRYGLQVITGAGLGMIFTILPLPMQASMKSVDDTGLAVGLLVSVRLFGGVVGLALSSTVFSHLFEHNIAHLIPLSGILETLQNVQEAIGFIPALRSVDTSLSVLLDVRNVYRESFMAIFLMLAGLGAIGAFTCVFAKELSLENEDMGRQRFEDQ